MASKISKIRYEVIKQSPLLNPEDVNAIDENFIIDMLKNGKKISSIIKALTLKLSDNRAKVLSSSSSNCDAFDFFTSYNLKS